jgi:glycine/D-amino acid oxidase-like deaminating enzyme
LSPVSSSGPAITVIGDGLAGSVLALCLARQGARVRLLGAQRQTATALSYGALPRGAPSRAWRRLEARHGPLGWRPSGLVFHDLRAGLPRTLAALTQAVPIPLARVDAPTWQAARGPALDAAGVRQLAGRVCALRPRPGGGWWLEWKPSATATATATAATATGTATAVPADDPSPPSGTVLEAETVVLAAGASARTLWPALPSRLRHSWAGVLQLERVDPGHPWLDQVRRGRIVQPRHWRRPALEAACAHSEEPLWIVDAGLAPRGGDGAVVGQISLIPPAGTLPATGAPAAAGHSLEPPEPQWMETRLREGLRQLDPTLAALEAPYRQVPVSFCLDGQPLVGPVAEAPGLWVFAGFSAAFSRIPARAETLAHQLLASLEAPPYPPA